MRRIVFVACIMAVELSTLCARAALGERTSVSIRVDSRSVAQDIDLLKTLAKKVDEQGYVSFKDNVSFRTTVERLIEEEVRGLTVSERQELVKETIGEDVYLTLTRLFVKQLGSSDISQRRSAIRSVGYPLFVRGATDEVKAFVFDEDRVTQLLAVQSLVYLDVPGASNLLYGFVLSGLLDDYDTAKAIKALYISNDDELDRVALAFVKMNRGGRTFKALLPVLRERTDYREIVKDVFKSDMFYVPDKEKMDLNEGWKVSAERDLLEEIFRDPGPFVADDEIRKKVTMYATAAHNRLYVLALLILEKTGQDLEYFKEMLGESQLPAKKRHVLELIVARIQKGQRLK